MRERRAEEKAAREVKAAAAAAAREVAIEQHALFEAAKERYAAEQRAAAAEQRAAKAEARKASGAPRYWTPEEHRLFMDAVQQYGWKDFRSIAQHVGTRTRTQVKTHAQKVLLRQQKEQTGARWP